MSAVNFTFAGPIPLSFHIFLCSVIHGVLNVSDWNTVLCSPPSLLDW